MLIRLTFKLDDVDRLAIGRRIGKRRRPAVRTECVQFLQAAVSADLGGARTEWQQSEACRADCPGQLVMEHAR